MTAAVAAPRTPVVVLHGITGSFLRNPGGEVWPKEGETARSLSDDHLDVLRLRADGRTPWSTTDPAYQISVDRGAGIDGIIDQVELCLFSACAGLSDVYAPTVRYLSKARGATANVIAHSQGGLVLRAALSRSRSVGAVDRVATLGTPFLGATQLLGVLDYQEPCQSAELFGGCVLNRAQAQLLSTSWPGALALLPSPAYSTAYRSPINRLIDDDGDGRVTGYLSQAQVRASLADRNLALIDAATALHRRLDPWTPVDPSVWLTRSSAPASGPSNGSSST